MKSFLLILPALLLACGKDPAGPAQSFAGLSRISSTSPWGGCMPPNQSGTNYRSAEVEPYLAVDPGDASHLIAVWQQDRWSNGGSNGLASAVSFDAGKTWAASHAAFTTCSGGNAANGATFERASDPWVTFAADGTPFQIGFSFNNTSTRQAMLVSRSADRGRSWGPPVFIAQDDDPDIGLDKESITGDPTSASFVYAVWDRLTGLTPGSATQTGPAWFTRTTDGGGSWEAARIIYDPGSNAQTIGNQIVVLPGGTLVALMTVITQLNQQNQPAQLAVITSADRGGQWSAQPVKVADVQSQGVVDPKDCTPTRCKPVRTGDIVASIAVDSVSGALYVAWEDSRFTGGQHDGIALASSTDGGASWKPPVRVNAQPDAQAFTPVVSAASGKVAVLYYDLRNDSTANAPQLLTTAWLAVSSDGGATFAETAVGGPFDIRSAALTSDGWFVGDYQGLVASGASFIPALSLANDGDRGNPSDIWARPPATPPAAFSAPLTALRAPPAAAALSPRAHTGARRAF